jgi:hypothetical protein
LVWCTQRPTSPTDHDAIAELDGSVVILLSSGAVAATALAERLRQRLNGSSYSAAPVAVVCAVCPSADFQRELRRQAEAVIRDSSMCRSTPISTGWWSNARTVAGDD